MLVENRFGCLNQAGVGNPGSVMASGDLTEFVSLHLSERGLGSLRIILDRDLGCHPPNGVGSTPVTGLDQKLGIGAKERLLHRNLVAIRQNKVCMSAKLFYETEDVIPPAAVEAGGMILQLPEDLVHLECGQDILDEDGSPNRAVWHVQIILSKAEYLIPKACFPPVLELW